MNPRSLLALLVGVALLFPVVSGSLAGAQEASQIPDSESVPLQPVDEFHVRVAAIRADLVARGLPSEILDRLDAFETRQAERIAEIARALGPEATREDIERALAAKPISREPILNPYPFRTFRIDRQLPRKPVSSFDQDRARAAYDLRALTLERESGASSSLLPEPDRAPSILVPHSNPAPGPEYVSQTDDIQFTQAIINKANELNHDPLKILNFVRGPIQYAFLL